MMYNRIPIGTAAAVLFVMHALPVYASVKSDNHLLQESNQQISDFSIAGYGDRGKKTWDLAGKSADIFSDTIKLKDIVGNLYGDQEQIKLSAERGDFNKEQGKVHLEKNVVVTTSSGARLMTASLDWDRKNQTVSTRDAVNIERQNMVAVASGATGQPNLNRVTLEKDVTVNINPPAKDPPKSGAEASRTVITCDGPLEVDYEKNVAVFNKNVKVDRQDLQIYSDVMYVYFVSGQSRSESTAKQEAGASPINSSIDKIVSRGNVKIVRGENVSFSDEAVYTATDRKITLSGRPKLIIYSAEDMSDASIGN